MTFRADRSLRFQYSYEAVNEIEFNNCAHGCKNAEGATRAEPGGFCPIIITVAMGLGDEVPEIEETKPLTCLARVPLDT